MRIFKRVLKLLLVLLIVLALFPRPKYQEENIWLKKNNDNKTLVMAHAGGKGVYPGNTLKAFEYSYNIGVDVLEIDVQMTLDNVLVLRHGENDTGNIRSMSNCDTVIWKETYTYLYDNCNFGYNYQEENGEYLYKDLSHEEWVAEKVYLTTLEELFINYGDTILYIIEIKADADAPRNETADALYDLVLEYDLFDSVLAATAFDDISKYIASEYPIMNLSASHEEAEKAIIMSYSFTSVFYKPGEYSALQIPTSFSVPVIKELNLSSKLLVWNLHRHNMAVHYWTINDEDEMRRLIELGADGIITDYPELLISILNE
jgi:glycerophosphoryl diester phosphodiesterase